MPRLLDPQNGIRFHKLEFSWYMERNLKWVTALVEACFDTLEYVSLQSSVSGLQ